MTKKCTSCGAKLTKDSLSCPACGAIQIESHFSTSVKQNPPKKKTKWWMFALPAVLVLLIALVWQPMMLSIAPGWVLSNALSKTEAALSQRYEGSPLLFLSQMLESQTGKVDIQATYEDPATDKLTVNVALEQDRLDNQISISGNLTAGKRDHSFSMFADKDLVALSYKDYMGGAFYGIEFDTFRQDLEKSAFSRMTQVSWFPNFEKALQQLHTSMDRNSDQALLEPYEKLVEAYFQSLTLTSGKGKVEIGSDIVRCDTVEAALTAESMTELLSQLRDVLSQDEALKAYYTQYFTVSAAHTWERFLESLSKPVENDLHLCFYLHRGKVLKLELSSDAFSLYFTAAEDVTLRVVAEDLRLDLVSHVTAENSKYTHDLTLSADADGKTEQVSLQTAWDRESGDLTLVMDDVTLEMTLQEEEGSVTLSFSYADGPNAGMVPVFGDAKIQMNLRFSQHIYIEKPDYKPLKKWNESDYNALTNLVDSLING